MYVYLFICFIDVPATVIIHFYTVLYYNVPASVIFSV